MARTGRPPIEIDKAIFENLCQIFCTQEEIADVFECSIDTVNRWCKRTYGETFADTYKKKCSKGKMSLRRWQYESAKGGNVTMQIFLGKNYLGQSDKVETEQTIDREININITPAKPLDEGDAD